MTLVYLMASVYIKTNVYKGQSIFIYEDQYYTIKQNPILMPLYNIFCMT